MTHLDYIELHLNGHVLKGNAIVEFCKNSTLQNEIDLGIFMADWLDSNPNIEVQTSGSTGIPKIIAVQKKQLLQSAAATTKFFNFLEGEVAVLALPIKYIAGKMMVVRALYSKLHLKIIEPTSHPFNSISDDEKIDFLPLTPMQLQDVTNTKNVQKILLGGAPISEVLEQALQTLKADIYHGYGMTETLSHVALRKVNGKGKTPYYTALPGVNFYINNKECLCIHVPFIPHPIVTNDLVELLNETTFIWKGRADHVVISGGIKLFPEHLENKLAAYIPHPFFIASISDIVLGEKLCLLIEAAQYSEEQLNQLKFLLQQHLKKLEIPKLIYFQKPFIYTESGKIQRKQTMQLLDSR